MLPVERALLVINRTAGTGQGEVIATNLSSLFKAGLGELTQVRIDLVDNHAAARDCAGEFLSESEAAAVVVAGGGGGTLRAVIEGICGAYASTQLPGPERVRVGALRLGSGNVLARQFGVPRDAVAGLQGLLTNLKTGRTVPCCVMRCEAWDSAGNSELHYGVTLGGLGQFGRIPADLARWHARFPRLHKSAARSFGIETLTNVEYALALLIRSGLCLLFKDSAETVEIEFHNQRQILRLLSGIVMNFPIRALPFKPEVRIEDQAVSVYLIPLRGRFSPLLQMVAPHRLIPHARCIRLEPNQHLKIRLTDRDCVEFFLDEDPLTTYGCLSLGVAGSIAFVPGPNYQPLADRGVAA
jgi:diacylglycerol kinase family enzyme